MGKNYRTSAGNFVENAIFQAPHQLMATAIQAQDRNFEDTIKPLEGTEVLYDNLDYADQDSGARQEKMSAINKKITELSEAALKNPALAKGLKSQIDKFRRDLEYDVKSGDFHKMNREAAKRKTLIAKINSRTGISEDGKEEALLKIERDYLGFDKSSFADNISIYDEVDETVLAKDLKQIINLDSESTSTTIPDGKGYMIQTGEVKTYLSEPRLQSILDSDPGVEKWKQEKEQILTRRLERGLYSSEEEMKADLKNKLDVFKKSVIEKLEFTKINTVNGMSGDSPFNARLARNQAAKHFNTNRLDKMGVNAITEITGIVDELSDSEVEGLVGSMTELMPNLPTQSYLNPERTSVELTTAKKRKYLNDQKSLLVSMLKLDGKNLDDFKEKMKTSKGREELLEITGMTAKEMSNQANYNKSFTYTTPVIPNYDSESSDSVQKQQIYLGTILKNINQLPSSTEVEVEVIKNRKKSLEKMTLAEAYANKDYGNRLLTGPKTTGYKKVPKTNAAGAYISVTGEVLQHPGKGKTPIPTAFTLKEATDSKQLAYVDKETTVLDNSKSLLNIKLNELFEGQDTTYDSFKSVSKNYYVAQKQIISGDGTPVTVHVRILKSKINPQILN
tara:strand:- start:6611 stop:8470 length:1860 start_codon:yes stop_codon:yes gene_type:complete